MSDADRERVAELLREIGRDCLEIAEILQAAKPKEEAVKTVNRYDSTAAPW